MLVCSSLYHTHSYSGLLSRHYAVCLIQPPMQSYHIAQWYIYQAKGVYRQHLHNTSFYGQHCNLPGILLCQLTGYRVMFVYTESNGDRVTSPRRWTCTSVQYITLTICHQETVHKQYTSGLQLCANPNPYPYL